MIIKQKFMRHTISLSEKKCRKYESQESTDAIDTFSLPQYIQVMVSNYQLLQRIFAISESECHTRDLKRCEQFAPTVTIVDTETQQPLDCVLLLCGEKPPEVSCRTLFCYIAVQVTSVPNYGSYPHPLCHMGSKPCKQGRLPLTFCFHKPGTVCNIRLSIHSILDSEGVEYMYHSEDCTSVIQIIEHGGVKIRGQHGVVRTKDPSLLMYTGPLATKRFHQLEKLFTKLYQSPNHKQIQQVSKLLIDERTISPDIKVFALCWEALSEAAQSNYKHAEEVLKTAWEKASQLECKNILLLQGRVLRHFAFIQYAQHNDDKALNYVSQAKQMLVNAPPSNETALTLYTDLRIKIRTLFSKHPFSSELYTSIEKEYELLLEWAKYMEDYKVYDICNFFIMKARFHLRTDLITDKLPPEEYWPSPEDLLKAEECLNSAPLDKMPSQDNYYTVRYYCTLSDFHIWKQQYHEAMDNLEKARELHDRIKLNPSMHFDTRRELIDRQK